ncbi:MAG: DEAD/DEAH box helicase family protein [Clostridia bacterium]|nr:DEAD/DEAH box helicase family protein [Clostridia bacterium]
MKKGSNAFDNLDWLRDIFSDGSNTGSSGAKGSKNGKGADNNSDTDIDVSVTDVDVFDEVIGDERLSEITSLDLPTDFENVYTLDPRATGVHAETVNDGLIFSLCNLGRVDIEYISAVTGEDYKSVISALRGSIYQNPEKWDECFYKGWELSDEYLSGNLIRKRRIADKANNKYKGYFQSNLDALDAVMPKSIATEDIYITLGSPWIPADIIDDFIDYLLGPEIKNLTSSAYRTRHSEELGIWEIPGKTRYRYSRYYARSYSTFGTARLEALSIIEKTLNQKTVSIYDEEEVEDLTKKSKKKTVRILNEKETMLALDRQEKILNEFKSWIWLDEKRKERLERIYEERYSSTKARHFDGSFLTFPGLNPDVQLFPYQKNAVARILFTPNTLLAHDVGSGKTYIMICAGMELRRMGIATKNMYVVPNNLVGQWRDTFLHMYQDANILVIEPKSFTPQKRWETLRLARDGDYDGIIIAYSCFESIPMSKSFEIDKLESEINALERNTQGLYSNVFAKQRQKLEKQLNEKILAKINPEEVSFDKLGITTIFLDEAHNYKNVPVETKIDRVLGISSGGSAKCQDMLDKIMLVQRTNGGRGAVLATGTPITNSLTDAFVMQKYLQNGDLKLLGLSSFDGWIGMFAEKHTDFEVDIDTSSYRLATRFSKFHNLPELTSLFASIADFHVVSKEDVDIPDFDGYTDNSIVPEYHFKKYLKVISERAEKVRAHQVPRKVDNLLLITTDGRKAALDMRLIDEKLVLMGESKAHRCACNIYKLYTEHPDTTQLVFCDYSTPKATFNLYDEVKKNLIELGVKPEEIEFVHSATTEKKRDKLFERVCKGEIRVLIGSTFKLGLGVNVQDKLIAIHHLDVPWRPADMVQREGRILRQGNTNPYVYIHRYITKGSFDAYSWQLLETKQRFISSLLSGQLQDRDGNDVCDTVLNYAEIKALAIGNPKIKERVETANELDKLIILRRESVVHREALLQELNKLPAKIEKQKLYIEKTESDLALYAEKRQELPVETRRELRERLELALMDNILMTSETDLFEYQGFRLVLPSGMTIEKPFIWIYGSGKYYLELGGSPLGYLVRIDNFLNDLDKHLEKLKANLVKLETLKENIETELTEDDRYSERIEALSEKLEALDKELGVSKK